MLQNSKKTNPPGGVRGHSVSTEPSPTISWKVTKRIEEGSFLSFFFAHLFGRKAIWGQTSVQRGTQIHTKRPGSSKGAAWSL